MHELDMPDDKLAEFFLERAMSDRVDAGLYAIALEVMRHGNKLDDKLEEIAAYMADSTYAPKVEE